MALLLNAVLIILCSKMNIQFELVSVIFMCVEIVFTQLSINNYFYQVNLTIEEHTRELLALNRKFGITLLDAVTLLQESDSFLESVKVAIIIIVTMMKMKMIITCFSFKLLLRGD